MDEQSQNSFEERSRALFHDSVEGLDMRLRSRLTQARHAAIEAASADRAPWLLRLRGWTPAAGVAAAALLATALWVGTPLGHHTLSAADGQANFEDLDLVASSDGSADDAMDMLQDDIEFYDWADRGTNTGPAA
jgi:hypothetical protein